MITAPPRGRTLLVGGDLELQRIGFGAMRITGPGGWGPPADPESARAVLTEALALGVQLIDTADSYGPEVNETFIAETLYPYPSDVTIATKGGYIRTAPYTMHSDGRPDHLRRACEGSLRRLRLDVLDLYYLHTPDPDVPYEESVGCLADLRREGKIKNVALSNVSLELLRRAQQIVPIAAVQNRYNLGDRASDDVLSACEDEEIAFVPWFPLARGSLAGGRSGRLRAIAQRHGATPGQLALAWLLQRSATTLPIPGTASVDHLRENVAAADVVLSPDELRQLEDFKPPVGVPPIVRRAGRAFLRRARRVRG